MGFAPDYDYNPTQKGDKTIGGVARLATILKEKRRTSEQKGPVIITTGGDFSMGTCFQMITRQKGSELQIMKLLGYDVIAIGNHEFELWRKRPCSNDTIRHS